MAGKLRTNVSKPYWCRPSASAYEFEEACLRKDDTDKLGWLDQLLQGGIVLPGGDRAVTILLTGPPGTGKSTLAMELASRWTDKEAWPPDALKEMGQPRILYVTTEAPADWFILNAKTYAWKFEMRSVAGSSAKQSLPPGRVNVMHFETPELVDAVKPESFANKLVGLLRPDREIPLEFDVEAMIIDSLNTFATTEERGSVFKSLSKLASSGPRVIVMVLDSPPVPHARDVWEFASDMVIRLDRSYEDEKEKAGYMIRTIELVKARYQNHVLGKHQLKIQNGMSKSEYAELTSSERMRAHPYRTEGGVFIFPSIHYTLSMYKRDSPTETAGDDVDASYVANLDHLLGKGYPKGRCTALVGQRGGHKSHLAYREILGRIGSSFQMPRQRARATPVERALIVSLRDDEGMVRQTLQGILVNTDSYPLAEPDGRRAAERAKRRLRQYEEADLLEIAYYPPGYITPEEFFHRLMLSIQRLKAGNSNVTLLFNSLDQLSSRFPLCANEPIFVPGVISTLTAEQVSSFFVTASSDGTLRESYGLETMAELILDFQRGSMMWPDYLPYLTNAFGKSHVDEWRVKQPFGDAWQRQAVKVSVARYAGGQAAGAEGVLELLGREHWLTGLCDARDLYFLPPDP